MSKIEVKDDRRYTKDHEWAKRDKDEVLVGISAYAVDQLGDITLVNFDVSEGDPVETGKPFGTVESVKTLADMFAPVSGTVLRLNRALEDAPELINQDCYGQAWLVAIAPSAPAELDALLGPAAYRELLAGEAH
ncbi:MAG: glycine cleavage system protein GcvH [Deltaproteobacteria bacterium]|nr:glycine cleavage system protein GcvH [Deltaproteobacteria bacterium]